MGGDISTLKPAEASAHLPGPSRACRVWLGTCAWSFADWRDVFYPDNLDAGAQLAYYARYLPAVEIDSTFYSIPRAEIVARWADATPDDFVFTAKLPRLLTHDARLRLDAPIPGHPGGDGRAVLRAFLGSLRPLGEKLGAVLVQLPPSFRPTPADVETLRRFLDALPAGGSTSFAVEFRHPSWHRPAIARLLREHGVAWCWNDTSALATQAEAPFEFLPQTADFLYVRLLGDLQTKFRPDTGERQYRYGRLLWPRERALESWAARLRRHLAPAADTAAAADAPPCRHVFILVNNHYEGFSPLTCQRLGQLLGIQLELPALAEQSKALPAVAPETDEQLRLF